MTTGSGQVVNKVGSFVPGTTLVLLGKWVNLFSAIHMTNPIWERWASSAALAIGTVLSIACIYLFADSDKPVLGVYAKRSLGAFIITAVLCYTIYFFLSLKADSEVLSGFIWPIIYIASMVSLCLFLTFLAMYDQKTSRVILIVSVVVGISLLVGFGVALYLNPNVIQRLFVYL